MPLRYRPLVIAIVGASGVGKDTAAGYLCNKYKWNRVVSYTTRQMRNGEQQGREHYFATEFPEFDKSDFAAYTRYGGHYYWVNLNQLTNDEVSVYVVDEVGLLQLWDLESKHIIHVIAVNIKRKIRNIEQGGIGLERTMRDNERIFLNESKYQYIIHNDLSIEQFFFALDWNIGYEVEYKRTVMETIELKEWRG